MNTFTCKPIGTVTSCYKEKFGIPRQPGLVHGDQSILQLDKQYGEETVRGLAGFSHIWVSFVFHATLKQGWKPMVRPPRLGGNTRVGVFASRSPFRPNSLGLSVVRLLSIETSKKGVLLHLDGSDLLDGTPVIDIKPYLPYVDAIPNADAGFAPQQPPQTNKVSFTPEALTQCQQTEVRLQTPLQSLIENILQLDPRPSYQHANTGKRVYSMKLYDFDLHWQYCDNNRIQVLGLSRIG